jgi:hypothetical protein
MPLVPEKNKEISSNVDQTTATIFNVDAALALLRSTICQSGCDLGSKNFYAIIHVLLWSSPSAEGKITPKAQNWYVYHSGSWSQYMFTDAKRLYGASSVYLLFIHLNTVPKEIPYTPRYDLQITKAIPANLQDVFLLASLVSGAGKAPAGNPVNAWGGRRVMIGLQPSTIQIDPRYVLTSSASNRGEEVAPAVTFSNEGKHYWDVSVGIPIKKISEVKFDTTNNVVTPTQTSTTNAFALLNFYYPPIDLASSTNSLNLIPHPIAGVAMAKQPLHKILVGGAIGVSYVELYAGALLVKQQKLTGLQTGNTATPSQLAAASHGAYETQFSIGINVPVRALIAASKKKSGK